MGKKTSFTIRTRMFISYISITLLLIATGLIGIFYVKSAYDNGNRIYENDLKAVEYLKSISENLKELDKCTFHLILDLDWEHDESCGSKIDDLMAENVSLMGTYSDLEISDKETELYEQGKESVLAYHEQILIILSMEESSEETELLEYYQEQLLPIKSSTNELIEAAVDVAVNRAEEDNNSNRQIYIRIIWIISLFMLVAVIISIIISYRMSNNISSKLKMIQKMAKRMSEYNISDDIVEIENDEFGQTVDALNESQFMMRELVERIMNESTVISDMGEEVSLAVRKSEQRIERVNVNILEYEKLAKDVEEYVKRIVDGQSLKEDEKKSLECMKGKLAEAKIIRDQARMELSSIVTYLEQIGITSDYQNEIANSHKEQVKKFKVKESEE